MSTLLIRNVYLNKSFTDIYIKDGLIAGIGSGIDAVADRIIEAEGKAAIPGFVNMHVHSAMTLSRGICGDSRLDTWLSRIWDWESNIDEEVIYWGTRLACLEMVRSGTTTFNDHYWIPDCAVKAVSDAGLRVWSSFVCMEHYYRDRVEKDWDGLLRTYENSLSWGDKAHFVVGCHSIYTVSEDMLVWAAGFAREHGLKFHIHLSETEKEVNDCIARHGFSPVVYLDRLGILDLGKDLIAAHALWLDEKDVELLGNKNVNVVHNINSNLKIASGYMFKYNELRDSGANVTLGTDGCASSDNLDMLEAMKTAALVQKAWRKDPKAMPVDELMDIASLNGSRALGLDGGVIEVGKVADLCLIDMRSPAFVPNLDFYSNLIYAAHSDSVDTVICGGDVVMEGRKVKDYDIILREASSQAEKMMSYSGRNIISQF